MILILTTITQNSDPLNLISLWARHQDCGHPGFTVHNTALILTLRYLLNICPCSVLEFVVCIRENRNRQTDTLKEGKKRHHGQIDCNLLNWEYIFKRVRYIREGFKKKKKLGIFPLRGWAFRFRLFFPLFFIYF